jgi:hypothetical protein
MFYTLIAMTTNPIRDETYFTSPATEWQRRYEALRASMVERLPDKAVANRFGYTTGYLRVLRHQFRHGLLDFHEPVPEGSQQRRTVNAEARAKIRTWREQRLSVGEIAELLCEDGTEISVRTVARVLAEEGFAKLPRRTGIKVGRTVKGAQIPDRSETVDLASLEGQSFECAGAGAFLFAPFIAQLGLPEVIRSAGLPESKAIPALNYFLSFLTLKLLGTERYAHVSDHAFDPGLGLFAGLNVLPKCTAMSTYSYSLDDVHIHKLQAAFVKKAQKLGLYEGDIINLDFHTMPHYGDESVLEKHWAGARGKVMKGALTLIAQDAGSKLMVYTASDIQRQEADDQVLQFNTYWEGIRNGKASPKFIFDSRLTSYKQLSALNSGGVKFITLRRRGKKLVQDIAKIKDWTKIHIPHPKRKFPDPEVHASEVKLKGYEGKLRQVVMRGNGHEEPAIIITNDYEVPLELLVGDYARRWRVENGIAEAVNFFHLNSLSSPILVKIHFDVALSMIADTLYSMLAHKLRGFEECNAPKICRDFVQGKATVAVKEGRVRVTYPRKAHNPILRQVPWHLLPLEVPGLGGAPLELRFL